MEVNSSKGLFGGDAHGLTIISDDPCAFTIIFLHLYYSIVDSICSTIKVLLIKTTNDIL